MGARRSFVTALSDGCGYSSDASLESRIGTHVQPQSNGCWLYNGDTKRPRVRINRRNVNAYRFVYETLIGPIPDGLVLHHTCETPGCVNPAHLEPMSAGDHTSMHAAQRRALSQPQ